MNPRITTHLTSIAGAAALAACAPVEPAQSGGVNLPDAGQDGQYVVDFPETDPRQDRYLRMTVSEDVRSICPIEPHFAFDEAEPRPQDQVALRALARCLEDPAMRAKEITLVGRTDRRGTDAYNMKLARRQTFA